ncbi:protein phosphatase 2C domain-containing protein [Besnoitia besnoiti]|uniref:Protein phosphatase 2C domain-containing protein n=1 Tax=Besnoitia besnoiti TaxID=94643 RepID=A0A2A9M658_BESBE|nr:protein phosphatase 2C domain-containing protein [Besnoitia besnoiti]PFH31801.1 protein phosphatase 2C domain-containing protein [Besnoitia besnoiti]
MAAEALVPPLWTAGDPCWLRTDSAAAGEEAEGKKDETRQSSATAGEGAASAAAAQAEDTGTENDVWFVHQEFPQWMFNPREAVYFNRETGDLVLPSALDEAAEAAAEEDGQEEEGDDDQGEDELEAMCEEEEEDEDFDLDLETDIVAGTAERKGTAEGKVEIEDRHVTKLSLPVGVVTGNANALCYYTAVFDGHDGSSCAQYAMVHLHKNLISLYRQIYSTVQRRRQEQDNKGDEKRRRRAKNFSLLLQQLNDGVPSARREEKFLSVGLESLVKATAKSFLMTDHNFLDHAQKAGVETEAGSTACVVLLFGPDEDGQLKIVTAHAGDTRAVLCRDEQALRLTHDHRPNDRAEKRRILQNGGEVKNIEGVWRVVFVDRKTNRLYGLATSRALGDRRLKTPKAIVTSQPTLHVYSVNFETDLFMVLASDGIWDVLSDEEVVSIVSAHLDKSPQEAARFVVEDALKRGSPDDKTCTVVFFKWNKDRFPAAPSGLEAAAEEQSEASDGESGSEPEALADQRPSARRRPPEEADTGEYEAGVTDDENDGEGSARRRMRRLSPPGDSTESAGGSAEERSKKAKTHEEEAAPPAEDARDAADDPKAEEAKADSQKDKKGDVLKAGRGLDDIGVLSSSDIYERIRKRREEEERQRKEEEAQAACFRGGCVSPSRLSSSFPIAGVSLSFCCPQAAEQEEEEDIDIFSM